MKKIKLIPFILFSVSFLQLTTAVAQTNNVKYKEPYRPQIHFSPAAHWMNDPNGMVYYKGTYHLFFQYYPGGATWGPMHWGHATSADLVHWQEQPIALYPDKLGYIFSGSAVADTGNTSGFGKGGKTPLVAIYTNHDTTGEKAHRTDFQTQSLAYSLDNGLTWTKYAGNPVLSNPGIADFRDPKVSWYAPRKKWIMTLAVKDHIAFYSSPDLKSWKAETEFGSAWGAHGGVWECPDLFTLNDGGKKVWVLTVSINPGGPNGGSATQYFTGSFNGITFTPDDTATRWIDYGTDNYAGVTWSNTGNRRLFMGWMSNWNYANTVPTQPWRSANTIPRELSIKKGNGQYYIVSRPAKELQSLVINTKADNSIRSSRYIYKGELASSYILDYTAADGASFALTLSNDLDEKVIIGFDKAANRYYIDRTQAGNTAFDKSFADRQTAPRLVNDKAIRLKIYVDAASVELFADDGLSVMTALVFPSKKYNRLVIDTDKTTPAQRLIVSQLKSIWK